MAGGTLSVLVVAGPDQHFHRTLAVGAAIFVNRHRLFLERLGVLHQYAPGRLWMQKADHPGQAVTGFLIEELDALAARTIEFARDVIGFKTQVMQSATTAGKKSADPVLWIERFQQFDLAVPDLE